MGVQGDQRKEKKIEQEKPSLLCMSSKPRARYPIPTVCVEVTWDVGREEETAEMG